MDPAIDLARETDFRLGDALIRPSISEVTVKNQTLRLQPRVMQVLVALAARAGEVVSRDQLIARCWGGLAVSEDSINRAVSALRRLSETEAAGAFTIETLPRIGYRLTAQSGRTGWGIRRSWIIGGSLSFLFLAIAAAWFALRPPSVAAHSMQVRLTGFEPISASLPTTMGDAVKAEIIAAFSEDGVVGVSTAPAPPPRTAPAYALGGTIERNGETIRVITRLTNERTGAILWSDSSDYEANRVSNIPRRIAVDAGNVVRCGLFGASTYHKPLSDAALGDYLQFCQGHWDPDMADGRKALIPAQRVVAAVPDFSWGWAAVAGGFWKVAMSADNSRLAEEARAAGRQAADRAIAIDRNNSEALFIKSLLIGQRDWIGRERLLKRAIAVRSLDCGCEHHQYGMMLASVGRIAEAVEQERQANDMLALYVYMPLSLAQTLVAAGKPEEASRHYDAAIELAPNSGFADWIAATKATETGDIEALLDLKLPIPAERRAALLKGYRALASKKEGAKARAVESLLALPEDQQNDVVARLLAALGANREAFQIARRIVSAGGDPSLFWYRSMRGALNDPSFPVVAEQLGLMKYWKTTDARPDVCNEKVPPPFCRMIPAASKT